MDLSSDRDKSEEVNVLMTRREGPTRRRTGMRGSVVITAVATTLGIAGCALNGLDGYGVARSPEAGPPAASLEGGAPSSAGTEAGPAHQSEWALLVDEHFDVTAELGHFADLYPNWASYDSFFDTRGFGVYDSDRVVSVRDGILTQHLRAPSSGPAAVVSITPPHRTSRPTDATRCASGRMKFLDTRSPGFCGLTMTTGPTASSISRKCGCIKGRRLRASRTR